MTDASDKHQTSPSSAEVLLKLDLEATGKEQVAEDTSLSAEGPSNSMTGINRTKDGTLSMVEAGTDPVLPKKRSRKANSLLKPEEGYSFPWTSEEIESPREPHSRKTHRKKLSSSPKGSTSQHLASHQEKKEAIGSFKVSNDSGGQAKPASGEGPKKGASNSGKKIRFVRSKSRPEGAGSGEKFSAEIRPMGAEPIDVGGYKVKASSAPILRAIFARHGDIAANCLLKSRAMRASALEVVCNVVKRLQSNDIAAIVAEHEATETEVADAEAAKLEVSWLRKYLEKIRKVGQRSKLLKEMKANVFLVSKAAKDDAEERRAELVAAQQRLREVERCVRVLECVAENINNDILESKSSVKGSSWRKQLIPT